MPQPRIWIVGQKSFGAAVLNLFAREPGLGLVVGVTSPPLDTLACSAKGYGVYRGDGVDALGPAEVDLIVNAHGHALIPSWVRSRARYGAIGYHPSLLPRHRGRSAIEWTIAMRDPITGGTVYRLDDGYDTGPILKQDWCHVRRGWNASDLWREELFGMGLRLIRNVLRNLIYIPADNGEPQDSSLATSEPPWDGQVSRLAPGAETGLDAIAPH